MAEAIALLGVVAAGVQCADAGARLLLFGSNLCSRLQNAPEKVQRWLDQIQQLITLAEFMQQLNTTQVSFSLSPSSTSTIFWVEAALLDCTAQARSLEDVLEEMLEGVSDSRGQKMWKKILTVKREARITAALREIERQQGLLNLWIGQSNRCQLYDLQGSSEVIRESLEKMDHSTLCIGQTVEKGVQNLSRTLEENSRDFKSSLEGSRNIILSGFESLQEQIHEQQHNHQSENAITHQQLNYLTNEMKELKDECRKLAPFQYQAAHRPSLLKETMDSFPRSPRSYTSRRFKKKKLERPYKTTFPSQCTCQTTNGVGVWTLRRIANMDICYRNVCAKDCSIHTNNQIRSTRLRFYIQSTLLSNLVKLSFEATHGAGGYSIGIGLQTSRMVRELYLEPIFRDIFHGCSPRNRKAFIYSPDTPRYDHPRYDIKKQKHLLKVIQKQLLEAFNSGKASPSDVDRNGRTLLHLLASLAKNLKNGEYGFGAQTIQLIISMGVKTDSVDNEFCTAQQLFAKTGQLKTSQWSEPKYEASFDHHILEWTELSVGEIIDGVDMVNCMRRWPESIDEWGYPYISDILLRQSKSDLESFIRRGMKPNELTSRLLTPLHLAAAAEWPEAIRLLLASGVDKYAQDAELCFPIDFAIRTHCLESILLLIDGDCIPYFTSPRKWMFLNIPGSIFLGLTSSSERIRSVLLSAIFRQKNYLKNIRLYHGLAHGPPWFMKFRVSVVKALLAEGVPGLNTHDDFGNTPLINACRYYHFEIARLLVENGANISERHKKSGLVAGHFLTASSGFFTPPSNSEDLKLCGKLLKVGFDMSNMAKFYCRCSPNGYTPITAIIQPGARGAREILHSTIDCLGWPAETSEKAIRAFALAMVFDRLGMKHTCVKSNFKGSFSEDDRLEIEIEEEEFNNQLEGWMKEYDMLRGKFTSGPLDFLDYFLELNEPELADPTHQSSWTSSNWRDTDFLGPGRNYNFGLRSFAGKIILYGHTEEVREENVLAFLFGQKNESVG